MIVIPAIDLRGGRCVRLHQGRSDRETVFSEDPVAVAHQWKELGAERVHVVDLDGAFAGEPRQTALVTKIVAAMAPVPVEVGGGLRDLRAVETALDVEDTATLAREVAMPILASGGVGRVEDLGRLATIAGVVGAVVGRALYTGAIDLPRAKEVAAAGTGPAGSSRG